MSRNVFVGIVALLALALPAALMATDCPASTLASSDTSLLVPESLCEYYRSGNLPEKLAYSIDLWHDAILKSDDKRAEECETRMQTLLAVDIAADQQLLGISTPQRAVSARELADHSTDSLGWISLDMETFNQTYDIVYAKQRLYENIKQSDSFSNRYRLLWDYIELTRRELGLPRLRLALGERATTREVRAGNLLPN
ncbi:MAG: hypothetical protein AB1644_13870 [Candidatus Zixiibacteriota bacterium]